MVQKKICLCWILCIKMMLFITASGNTRILMDWCSSEFSYFQYTTKSSEIVYNNQNVNMIQYKCGCQCTMEVLATLFLYKLCNHHINEKGLLSFLYVMTYSNIVFITEGDDIKIPTHVCVMKR